MADDWGVAPATEATDEWGVKPVSSALPPTTEPKPSLLRRGVNAVGGALAEIPQIAYEGAVAIPNAMYRGVQHATTTVPAFLGGVAGGSSMEDSARMADVERQRIAQSNLLPPTLGEGSWFGQGINYGVNQLVERGIISPESAQGVGDLLAIVGGGGVANRLRGASQAGVGPTYRGAVDRFQAAFPKPDVRAGEMLYNTRKAVPVEVPSIASRAINQETAKAVVGDQRFPETASPNIRRQQLAASRKVDSADVRATETATAEAVQTKANTGLETAIPRENIDPARLDFLNKKLEAHNAAQTAAADATTAGAKTAAQAGVESAARAALDEVELVIPKTGRLDPLPMGQRILERVRGTDGESGLRAVRKVFNEEYGKFDKAGAVASSADLMDAVKDSANLSTEAGRVLRGFVDDAKKIEQRLGSGGIGPEGGDVFNFPDQLTLKQFRGLKGEFSTAADLARKSNNRPAAMELDRLAEIARKGENGAVESLGPEMATQYDAVRSAYKNTVVEPFYRGYGGKMVGFGSQSGGGRVPPAGVFSQLMNRQNAHDFTLALGAEEAAKSGKLLQGLGEADLLALGRGAAQETVRPYVESTLSTLYENAGGGKKGVAAVEKYLNTNANTIDAYGLDVSGLRTAATKYNEAMSRLTGAKSNVAKGVVEGVIPTADPMKLGGYVFDSASPASAYRNLLGVSKDSAWKASIDTLMIDELKKRMDAGKDVFSDVKTRAAMEAIWSPRQMKTLKAYHAVVKELSEPPARFKGEGPSATMQEAAMGALQAAPPGFSWRYFIKGGIKLLAKMGIKAGDEAMYSFLDDALMNPAKADMIVQAYKGSARAKRQLASSVETEAKTWKDIAKLSAKNTVRRAAAGAVSNAGQKAQEKQKSWGDVTPVETVQ